MVSKQVIAMNSRIGSILTKAGNREKLSIGELRDLLDLPTLSTDTYRLLEVANFLTRTLASGEGVVGAQIGLNVEPCSMECEFCSFGRKHTRITDGYRLTVEQLQRKVEDFLQEGVNYISLMTTADYSFDEYLRMSEAARKLMPPEMMLSANIGDFGSYEARMLKAAGFGRVYHPVRLDEGERTRIAPASRVRTLEAAAAEDLELAFCIEPVGPEHTSAALAEMMDFSLRFKPTTAAVMRRIPIEGTVFETGGIVSEIRMAQVMAVLRLAYAHSDTLTYYVHEPSMLGLAAGANLICAETAGNPRELVENTESVRGFTPAQCRDYLFKAGYSLRKEPNFPGSWFTPFRETANTPIRQSSRQPGPEDMPVQHLRP
jgi:biotin synthase